MRPMPPISQPASGSTAVLEYRPTETLPVLGAMLLDFARLCRRRRPARPPPWRKTWASPGMEGEIRRDTDCLLEGDGFELPVPGIRSSIFIPPRRHSSLFGELAERVRHRVRRLKPRPTAPACHVD